MAKRVFSGIKPTGQVHLGNYLGALKQWGQAKDAEQTIYCIVDLHAITISQKPQELRERTRQLAAFILASGVDPEKSLLFVQSHNLDHANLAWVLNCNLSMGQMARMTQYKEKSEKNSGFISVGLFDYPALMAADILLYDTTDVPVGDDQKQHVELSRDVAERFNKKYGETFVVPTPVTPKIGGRVMSLTNPLKKMSKSEDDPNGTINLMDSSDEVYRKVMSAVTDSENSVKYNMSQPGIFNLIEIYSQITEKSPEEVEVEFQSKGYGEFKKAVAEQVILKISELQDKYKELINSGELDRILKNGSEKAQEISSQKLRAVYEKVGFLARYE